MQTNSPSIVPGGDLGRKDFEYYFDQAREICRRVQDKAHLTDDEIIILAVVAAQLALAKYAEPDERDADATLDEILSYLDHEEVADAIFSKMDRLLEDPRGSAREAALSKENPGALDMDNVGGEPAGDPDGVASGDEPMTAAQASYLKTLCEQAHEPGSFNDQLTKAQALKLIDRLRQKVGLGYPDE
jgi:hypothetical protein